MHGVILNIFTRSARQFKKNRQQVNDNNIRIYNIICAVTDVLFRHTLNFGDGPFGAISVKPKPTL